MRFLAPWSVFSEQSSSDTDKDRDIGTDGTRTALILIGTDETR